MGLHRSALLLAALLVSRPHGKECDSCDAGDEGALLQLGRNIDVVHHHPDYAPLGCYRRADGDVVGGRSVYEDRTCMIAATPWTQYNASRPCRSGLPFYRLLQKREQGFGDCNLFCLSKGFDISGIVVLRDTRSMRSKVECRCGASSENRGAWQLDEGIQVPVDMMLSDELKVEDDDPRCEIYTWRYKGELENDAVPRSLMVLSDADITYISEVATGMVIGVGGNEEGEEQQQQQQQKEAEDPGDAFVVAKDDEAREENPGEARAPGFVVGVDLIREWGESADAGDPALYTPSVPAKNSTQKHISLANSLGLCKDTDYGGHPCSVVRGQCQHPTLGASTRRSCPVTCGVCHQSGGWMPCYPNSCDAGTFWEREADGIVRINYYLGDIDRNRRETFRAATKFYEKETCIRFIEKATPVKPYIRAVQSPANVCSCGIGRSADGVTKLTMGWCKSSQHVGNIVHELGHAIGMDHENKRPDSSRSFHTPSGWKGQYIWVKWAQVSPLSQYKPKDSGYIGSDKTHYVPYDYESIMHYAAGKTLHAKNELNTIKMGNRDHLSPGDIRQINDMYGCGGASSSGGTAQQAQSQPSTGACADQHGAKIGGKYSCSAFKGRCSDYLGSFPELKTKCKETCGLCGGSATKQPAGGACADQHGTKIGGQYPCSAFKGRCSDYLGSFPELKTKCKETCGLCGGSATKQPAGGACADQHDAKIAGQYSCSAFKGRCSDYLGSFPELKTKCKETCGLCGDGATR